MLGCEIRETDVAKLLNNCTRLEKRIAKWNEIEHDIDPVLMKEGLKAVKLMTDTHTRFIFDWQIAQKLDATIYDLTWRDPEVSKNGGLRNVELIGQIVIAKIIALKSIPTLYRRLTTAHIITKAFIIDGISPLITRLTL